MGGSVNKIALKFLHNHITHTDKQLLFGIADGYIGELACFAYMWKNSGESVYHKLFLDMFYLVIDSPINDYSLGYGLASLAWLINQLRREKLMIDGLDEIDLDEINRELEKEFYLMVDARNFDYFKGATGLIMYFSQQENKALFSRAAKYFVKEVERCLHERYKFYTIRNNGTAMERFINIGVPHGLTGILLTLLLIEEKNAEHCKGDIVLDFAGLLLTHRFENPDKSYFPSFVYEYGRKDESGIAWCYGDLMIAYSFLKMCNLSEAKEFVSIGKEMIANILKRDCLKRFDLCLCHGLPSIYHIFKAMYVYSQIEGCRVIAENAYDKMERLLFEKAERNNRKIEDDFFKNHSLFYGYPAAFLTILTKDNPYAKWQKCLLL